MVYVKHFDILGVDTAQIPCIELNGVPNAATVGAVGLLGMDMTSEGHEIYVCTAVNGSVYTWQCIKSGKDGTCVNKAEIINDELILTLSNGVEINAGVVRGETGKAGKDGKDGSNGADGKDGVDGKDGISVVKADFNESLELILTLSDGSTITAGKVIPEMKDLVGSVPIGSDTEPVYWDGEKLTVATFAKREFTLETATWEQIKAIADAGKASEYFYVGEEKNVMLDSGEELTFVILGFNHDTLADGGTASITFGMKHLLSEKAKIGDSNPTNYSYTESEMHAQTLFSYAMLLPSELERCIVRVHRTYGHYFSFLQQVNDYGQDCDKLFLFTACELGLEKNYTDYPDVIKVYDYYKGAPWRLVKRLSNGTGDICGYWTGDHEIIVSEKGTAVFKDRDLVYGICFGFCI